MPSGIQSVLKPLFWLRSLLASAALILITFCAAVGVIFSSSILRSRKAADRFIWLWGLLILKSFNVRAHLVGSENIPDGGCLFVFNHSSNFDIFAIHGVLRKSARFGAKIELFKIPIFGWAMRVAGALPIARAERDKVFRLYDESIARVHRGESFILAAEGTRQPVPGVGTKFKTGPFVFAINGQFPIVPVVIRGAAECLPKNHLIACTDGWSHEIQVQILPSIETKGLTLEDRPRLVDQVQNLMTTAYAQR